MGRRLRSGGSGDEEWLAMNASFIRGALRAGAQFVDAGNPLTEDSPYLDLEYAILYGHGVTKQPRDPDEPMPEDCE